MPTVLLIRHARSAANAKAVLAGRTPGVGLDEAGLAQAEQLAARVRDVPLAAIVSSPLERCLATATPLAQGRTTKDGAVLAVETDDRLLECDYGDWTNRELRALAKEPQWKAVQAHPSSVQFPGGETMRGMQARGVDAIRSWEARLAADAGPHAVWAAITHADVIKAILADALGTHLDEFQRIVVDTASVSIVRFTELRPFVLRINDTGGTFGDLMPPPARRRRTKPSSDAVVGGPTGTPA